MNAPVRVALVLDSLVVPHWIYKVAFRLYGSGAVSLRAFFLIPAPETRVDKPATVYRLHEQLDRFVFKSGRDYDETVDLSNVLPGMSDRIIPLLPDRQPVGWVPGDLDILLKLTDVELPDWLSGIARLGIWSVAIGPVFGKTEICPGYREMIRREPFITVTVTGEHPPRTEKTVIHRSYIPVHCNSMHINRQHAFGLYEVIIIRLMEGLHRSGPGFLRRKVDKFRNEKIPGDRLASKYDSPSNLTAVKNMAGIFADFAYRKLFLRPEFRWYLMVDTSGNNRTFHADGFRPLIPPGDRFWADPFVVDHRDRFFIFAEEFLYKRNKGHISVLELDLEGNLLNSSCILEKSCHMSYPFVFRVDESWYMIPETSENRTIELYQCLEFPYKWKFVMNLAKNTDAVDTTLFRHNDIWWMFTAVSAHPGFPDYRELFVYYSDNLFTANWHSHPENPVVSDIRTARPAGAIFCREGKIFRPSQDCSGRYGRAVNIHEIDELTTSGYSEHRIARIRPRWKPELKGLHTLNSSGGIRVTDVYKLYKRFE